MRRAAWLLVTCLLAGCSSGGPSTVGAMEAAEAAHAEAAGTFEYALFLGITGTEGDLNWTAYEAALRDAADPGQAIAGAFDQDQDHGEMGDGRLGSWLSTHFIYDQQRQLLGGLYTQSTPDGTTTAFTSFRGPYSGTPALPALAAQEFMRKDPEPQALCGLVSSMDRWEIDADEAASIALARPMLREEMAATPEGELTYYYFPRLDVTPGCDGQLDTPSNFWTISYTDLDAYLAGGSPDVVEITIDAESGEVLAEERRVLGDRSPVVFEAVLQGTATLLERSGGDEASFSVAGRPALLEITAQRTEAPLIADAAELSLIGPDGEVWDTHPVQEDPVAFRVTSPGTGEWRLAYSFDGGPGDHRVEVQAVVHY